ncbi:MAG TPA: ABC transporter permease subunit [Amnibacterium sp.]|jgi:osmoprotectant transport system permease protein|nr:ABC transporter permease subunit [Amnibacterium sp.]
MDWVWTHLDLISGETLAHIGLSVPPIVIGLLVSIPLGYWASRSAVARSVLLTVGNILYTIPALALVVLVPVVLGLSLLNPLNVVAALTIYAVAIMVRSAADAFASVSADVRESATAQGYSASQRFFRVELPLAGPVLLAGVRVVSVSTISLVTIGALVGIPSLGSFFTDGFQRAFPLEVAVGFVLVLVLAAVFDVVLTLLGWALLPWNRGARLTASAARVLSQPQPSSAGVP